MELVSPQQSTPQVHYRDRWVCWKRDEARLTEQKCKKKKGKEKKI